MEQPRNNTRRKFIKQTSATLIGAGLVLSRLDSLAEDSEHAKTELVIDIHQHTDYHGRTAEQLLAHQRTMGISITILLPAGTSVNSASTHNGISNGLQAKASGNQTCYEFARQHPGEFFFGANEVSDLPDATREIERFLKLGAKVIGESKFGVECDSKEMQKIYQLADSYNVPVLMHWQHEMYNYGFDRFHKMLEKYPKVDFIGHAQTWWANVDKNHTDQKILYPKSGVTPGGLTDRYLSDYPNMFADMSAGSGLNALLRDEDHARGFIDRHQDKLLYGSDCADATGVKTDCDGARIIEAIKKLAPDKKIQRKLLYENAKKLFRL